MHSLYMILLGLCYITYTTAQNTRECPPPPILLNAGVDVSGDTATYTCNTGYSASGSMHKTCRDGVWQTTGTEPLCTAQLCPNPPRIERASSRAAWGSSYVYGTVIEYNCYGGYEMETSTSTIMCQANQTWSKPYPSCKPIECGAPPFIANGNVTYTETTYNSEAIYRCFPGYDLIPPNSFSHRQQTQYVSRCSINKQWMIGPTCSPKSCGMPFPISHGMKLSGPSHLYGDTVLYQCEVGYRIHGNETISCGVDGTWTPQPECVAVTCNNPPKVENAVITSGNAATYGNTTWYMCKEGYKMSGYNGITCQADGSWTEPPECLIVDCRTPPSIHYGTHNWTSTTYGSKVTYTCDEGYKLIGVAVIECQEHGWWTNSPVCEKPPGSEDNNPPPNSAAQQSVMAQSDPHHPALNGLAVTCAILGVVCLLLLITLAYKFFYANRSEKLFSYASYNNGEEGIHSGI